MLEHPRAPHQVQERPLSALDAIFTRRSVRTFAPQPVDEPTIQALLDAAVQAPTALHAEPWSFVVVQDRATLKRISDRSRAAWNADASHYRDLHHGADADVAQAFAERLARPDFCVFYDAGTLVAIGTRSPGPFAAADCWLAAENLMIAACALGLGTCCIGSSVPALNDAETKRELHLPSDLEIIAPIVVGVVRGEVTELMRQPPTIVSWTRSKSTNGRMADIA